jgi:predicted short-subunit dehydrogenase-like oxidoreductase (DUF2520 family)
VATDGLLGINSNIERAGIPAAVAGPYGRGDVGTIRRHLETLRTRAPEVLPLYRELALAALPFGVEKQALSPEQSQAIVQLLRRAPAGDSGAAGALPN